MSDFARNLRENDDLDNQMALANGHPTSENTPSTTIIIKTCPAGQRQADWIYLLSDDERKLVNSSTTVNTVAKGKYIKQSGDPFNGWLGICSGLAVVSADSHTGKSAYLDVLQPSEWFGDYLILANRNIPFNLIALRNTQVQIVSSRTFNFLYNENAKFRQRINEQSANALQSIADTLLFERTLDSTSRLAQCILKLCMHSSGANVLIDVTQTELGLLANISRQAVNHGLQTLKSAGLIHAGYSGIKVLKVEELRKRYLA